jgi:tetratricopeptide (TPR) repeat protein
MAIAKKMHLPEVNNAKADVMQLVTDYLAEQETGPWLMILDNTDDLEVLTASPVNTNAPPLASYIPRSACGQVIITTRDAHVGLVLTGGRDPLNVYPLTPKDASLLLRTSLIDEPDPEPDTVLQILNILDCLPLAINQACAYINRNRITTTQYFALLTENDAGLRDLLSDDQYDLRRGFDSINSVIRTWKLSFDQIQKKYAVAAKLLSVMAFLNRQDIPRDLLIGLTESQQQLTSALGVLHAFSLIKAERGAETYSMHRLVQFVTCVWQEMQSSKSQHQEQALNLVLAKFPAAENEDPTMCQSLLPHAYAVQNCAASTMSVQIRVSNLQYNMSWFEDWRGHYQAANDLCSAALQTRKIGLGGGHLDTLHASDLLGTILQHQGNYTQAALIHKETLKQKGVMLGPSHLDTVQSLNDLTDIFIVQGDFEAAEDSARKVLTARTEILGTEHLKTLSVTTTLAYIFMLRGNFDEARELAQGAVEKYQRILGCEHEKTLQCTSTLYQILREMGEYQEAINLCVEVITVRRALLGPEHPHTLSAINNLAMLRRNTGDFEVAEQLYRSNIAIFEKNLGAEHPETMANSSNLAVVLRDQGKFEEAEEYSRRTLERRDRVLGKDNPRTLITLNEHAILLDMVGKYDEAFEAATRGLQARLKARGEEHPDCATSMYTLASVVRHRGDLDSARDLLERALGIRMRMLKDSHPDTLACVVELRSLLEESKDALDASQ